MQPIRGPDHHDSNSARAQILPQPTRRAKELCTFPPIGHAIPVLSAPQYPARILRKVLPNSKFRVMQRRAYGLPDEEYLRLKVLTCRLPQFRSKMINFYPHEDANRRY